ncbi:hypothetical protein Anas_12206 [Armadillidium nasatum]|uniref:Uncharacterized protein n=1 Tax=Armadillidium nasatum TaxID=96803 RepID=A0A5N5SZ71_9CRUS|nr:hypothetical protein Anas_12206 [Armadillidium nasatum]
MQRIVKFPRRQARLHRRPNNLQLPATICLKKYLSPKVMALRVLPLKVCLCLMMTLVTLIPEKLNRNLLHLQKKMTLVTSLAFLVEKPNLKTGNEEFADFSSFQTPSVTSQAPSGNSLSNSSLLMDLPSPNTGPPLTNSTVTPNNNLNFLDGLLEPSSTIPSGSSVTMTAGANNADLLSGLTSSMTSLNIVPSSGCQSGPTSLPLFTSVSSATANSDQAITGTSGRWANSGVNINLDNLFQGTPKKTAGPPMNRMNSVGSSSNAPRMRKGILREKNDDGRDTPNGDEPSDPYVTNNGRSNVPTGCETNDVTNGCSGNDASKLLYGNASSDAFTFVAYHNGFLTGRLV